MITRTMAVAVGLALFILLAGGAWFYHAQYQAMRQKVENDLSAIARLKAFQIAAWRKDQLQDAASLSKDPFLAESIICFMADPGEENRRNLRRRFQSLADQHDYSDILLVNPGGTTHLHLSGKPDHRLPYASTLSEAIGKGEPVFIDLHVDTPGGPAHVSVVAPFYQGKGKERKALAALILITNASEFLYPLIQFWPTSSRTAETLLVQREVDQVLFLNELRHRTGTALSLRIPLSRADLPAAMAIQGTKGFVEGKDYRGVEVVAVILPIPESAWFMISKIDAAEAFAEWRFRSALLLSLLIGLSTCLGTAGLLLWQREKKELYRTLYLSESASRANAERHSVTLNSIGDAVISTDVDGRVELLNPVAESLTGWTLDEARGKSIEEIFRIVNEETRETAENPVARVLHEGTVVGLANHTLLIARDGTETPIADSGAPIRDDNGKISGVVLVFRDQTEERRSQRLHQARLALLEYAPGHTVEELLTRTLDEIGELVDSPIGFYHFVEPDQKTLSLQQWSTRTLKEFCRTDGRVMHYSIDQAGVWVDAVREKKPMIHNEYTALPHKKGMPEGHAEVLRELVVPVIRQGKVVGVLGVGNKPVNYTDRDAETVAFLADVTWHLVEQKKAEVELRKSEEKYHRIYENSVVGIFQSTPAGRFTAVNPAFVNMLGYDSAEDLFLSITDIAAQYYVNEEDRRRYLEILQRQGQVKNFEFRVRRKDGAFLWVSNSTGAYFGEDGRALYYEGIVIDISEQKHAEQEREKLQDQLLQARKMESVGRLAGGVAHDYNNMLGVILGYTEMALERVDPADPLHEDLSEILTAARRSESLTRQLLAFARRQTISPEVLDMNETIENMLKMLRRLIGEDIDLFWKPGKRTWSVYMDPAQLDQVLANLCVNARDAIAGVGKITIETGASVFDETYCADHAGYVPGQYTMLAVSDNGCGMDAETVSHLFEPFFTTKKSGEGTGLGLATIYGIVKQNEGFINVYSEPGKGSTFRIYLPRHAGAKEEKKKHSAPEVLSGSGETVLLVEDEPSILKIGVKMLERLGYRVLAATGPGEAESLAEEHGGDIHLLITDVVMPEMNGRELAERLQGLYPDLKILFMSGYTADVIAHRGVLEEGVFFMQKPFSKQELAAKVREALEG